MNKYEEVFDRFNLSMRDENIHRETVEIIAKAHENHTPEVLRFLYSCIDLTLLRTEDSRENIWKFTEAVNDFDNLRSDMQNVAAVCVYPNFVATVKEFLRSNVRIASVAGGFPSSQTFQEVKIAEVLLAIAAGAEEIDIVLNCGEFLDNNMEEVANEIMELKEACCDARLKVILETGLLKTTVNIKKAAILAMYAGADFIKTSTGKVYPGATPEVVYVICGAIRKYYQLHAKKIGIKVSGGVCTSEDAVVYYTIVKTVLGEEWLTPDCFRIGASSLAQNLLYKIL